RRGDLQYGAVQGQPGPHRRDQRERPDRGVVRPERRRDARPLRHRRRAAGRPGAVGAPGRRPVGDDWAESHARLSRRQRHSPRVTWRDAGGHPAQLACGGVVRKNIAPASAHNRVLLAEVKGASLAAFTPPHTFFFTREVHTNPGYVWYRKDSATTFAIGIRQA